MPGTPWQANKAGARPEWMRMTSVPGGHCPSRTSAIRPANPLPERTGSTAKASSALASLTASMVAACGTPGGTGVARDNLDVAFIEMGADQIGGGSCAGDNVRPHALGFGIGIDADDPRLRHRNRRADNETGLCFRAAGAMHDRGGPNAEGGNTDSLEARCDACCVVIGAGTGCPSWHQWGAADWCKPPPPKMSPPFTA